MTELAVYKTRDLVWAKMKGFSPWPAMIVDPPNYVLKIPKKHVPAKCVFFFGTNNFAWIEISNLKHYEGDHKDDLMKQGKTKPFKEAVEQVEIFLKDPTFVNDLLERTCLAYDSDAEFNKIRDGRMEDESSTTTISINQRTPKRLPKLKAKSLSGKSLLGRKSGSVKSESMESSTSTTKKRKRGKTVDVGGKKKIDFLPPSSSRRSANPSGLLDRPVVTRPDYPQVDMRSNSANLSSRDIVPSELTFGFLGLGIMGSTIVKNLICTGHKVVVWNRTASKCEPFAEAGADVKLTPSEVVEVADIIFCCVSDPQTSKDLVFGNCGVLQVESLKNKGYVEMSTIDPETSKDIAEGISSSGGIYLEAQIQGTRKEVEEGNAVILAGGSRSIFDKCSSCFKSIARNTFFLGDTGNACKVNLIIQAIVGVSMVGLSEALALADRFSISLTDTMDIIELTSIKSEFLISKGKDMAKGEFNPQLPLSHLQKDLRLALNMAESVDQAMPTTAIANEVFKHAKRLGYNEHDSSAVYVRARF